MHLGLLHRIFFTESQTIMVLVINSLEEQAHVAGCSQRRGSKKMHLLNSEETVRSWRCRNIGAVGKYVIAWFTTHEIYYLHPAQFASETLLRSYFCHSIEAALSALINPKRATAEHVQWSWAPVSMTKHTLIFVRNFSYTHRLRFHIENLAGSSVALNWIVLKIKQETSKKCKIGLRSAKQATRIAAIYCYSWGWNLENANVECRSSIKIVGDITVPWEDCCSL